VSGKVERLKGLTFYDRNIDSNEELRQVESNAPKELVLPKIRINHGNLISKNNVKVNKNFRKGTLADTQRANCKISVNTNNSCNNSPQVISEIKDLKILHQNIQSARHKNLEIEVLISEEQPDVVCFSEHSLSSEELLEFKISGYKIIDSYSRTNKKWGGVVICAKVQVETTCFMIEEKMVLESEGNFEYAMAKIIYHGRSIILITIYRPPKGSMDIFLGNLSLLLDKILINKKVQLFICGDYNIDISCKNPKRKQLREFAKEYGLTITINTPTRVTEKSSSIIDNVLTNSTPETYSAYTLNTAIADHYGQIIELKPKNVGTRGKIHNPKQESRWISYRDMSETSIRVFSNLIFSENWGGMDKMYEINDKYENFATKIEEFFYTAFPIRKKRIGKGPPSQKMPAWLTSGIKKSRLTLKGLSALVKINCEPSLRIHLRKYKAVYRKVIRSARAIDIKEFIRNSDNKAKAIWKIINNERGSKSLEIRNKGIQLQKNGKELSDQSKVAEFFNTYFTNEAQNVINSEQRTLNELREIMPNRMEHQMILHEVTRKEVLDIINKIKNKKSSGHDNISPFLLKKCAMAFSEPLTYLINQSFAEGKFPNALKIAKVIPLYKKGNVNDIGNYRPVSILPAISKVFEKAFENRLKTFLVERSLMSDQQHGFRIHHSTSTAISSHLKWVIGELEKKKTVVTIYMDLTKAFDSIEHKILLDKLNLYGLREKTISWLTSYLEQRKQYVEIKSEHENGCEEIFKSNSEIIKRGVPQGSILGPTLFNIYINDIVDTVTEGNIVLFADDATLSISNESIAELEVVTHIQLNNVVQWLKQNSLIINDSKTKFMLYHIGQQPQKNINVQIDNKPIEQVYDIPFLGTIIDQKLNWNLHVDRLSKKLLSGLYVLKKLVHHRNKELLILAYFALIESHIRYGICAWGNSSQKNVARVLKYQKRAIRIIEGLRKDEPCRKYYLNLNIMTVPSIYIHSTIMLAISNDSLAVEKPYVHNYNTRCKENVNKLLRLRLSERSPENAAIKLYNFLPNSLKCITNYSKFSLKLKEHLTKLSLYSIEEFVAKKM
jgi:Reverse transcriptase (RNA-dependent DNA polymerase)